MSLETQETPMSTEFRLYAVLSSEGIETWKVATSPEDAVAQHQRECGLSAEEMEDIEATTVLEDVTRGKSRDWLLGYVAGCSAAENAEV